MVRQLLPVAEGVGRPGVVRVGLYDVPFSPLPHYTNRVEGQGAAVITDVIYSSETEPPPEAGKGVASSGSKEEYEGLRAEIQEREGELKRLRFKEEVLERQRTLLRKFADHVSKGQSGKVNIVA